MISRCTTLSPPSSCGLKWHTYSVHAPLESSFASTFSSPKLYSGYLARLPRRAHTSERGALSSTRIRLRSGLDVSVLTTGTFVVSFDFDVGIVSPFDTALHALVGGTYTPVDAAETDNPRSGSIPALQLRCATPYEALVGGALRPMRPIPAGMGNSSLSASTQYVKITLVPSGSACSPWKA